MEEADHINLFTKKNKSIKKGSICLHKCTNPIIHDVALSMGMNEVNITDKWDLWWSDSNVDIKKAKHLKNYQKLNHFPGMSEVCRKDLLARNLNTMVNKFPDEYTFFPKTWYLPTDYIMLQDYIRRHRSSTYILKPSTGSRGTGIYLSKSLKKIDAYEKMICQLYVSRPLLIDGFKFDMRVYTLIASCDPLKLYVYNDGLVRLATEPYDYPTTKNLNNRFMHLTNYSVNRHSKTYIDDENYGSKRRISTLNNRLRDEGQDVNKIWNEIDDVIIKTIILSYPLVSHSYKVCFSGHKYMPACFDILGFDILLDEDYKPHLLEVNHSPDLHTNTTLDKTLKRELLSDTFKLLQLDKTFQPIISTEEKKRTGLYNMKNIDKIIFKQRILSYKESFEKQINLWESENMGNYRLVFSEKNSALYEQYFYSNENTLYKKKCPKSKEIIINKKLGIQKIQNKRSIIKPIPINSESIKQLRCNVKNNMNRDESDKSIAKVSISSKIIKKGSIKRRKSPLLENNKLLLSNIHKKTINTKEKISLIEIENAVNLDRRIEIEKIKEKNKKRFPDVQSCLFKKYNNKKKCSQDGWNEAVIDQIDENVRMGDMLDRDDLVFKQDIKEYIYKGFAKLNNLWEVDHADYAEFKKKKNRLGIKPFTYNIVFKHNHKVKCNPFRTVIKEKV